MRPVPPGFARPAAVLVAAMVAQLGPASPTTIRVDAIRIDGAARSADVAGHPAQPGHPTLAGCPLFPADNIWNWPVVDLPLHPLSTTYIQTIGETGHMHADFGSGLWNGGPIGIPFVVVPGTQPRVPVTFEYADESDPGPYPIPSDAPIEGGAQSSGDRHILVVDEDECVLYETWSTYPNPDGSWRAGSGARFDLRSNALRPDTWTSADAAGLPILPGLVRYDEVAAGEIRHALRFTVPQTQRAYLWPARHFASHLVEARYPPMGLRLRLRAEFDDSGFSPEARVITEALKRYGMILADNGSAWFLSGVPDERWANDHLRDLGRIAGADFEAVDASGLMADPNSGRVAGAALPSPTPTAIVPAATATATDPPSTATIAVTAGPTSPPPTVTIAVTASPTSPPPTVTATPSSPPSTAASPPTTTATAPAPAPTTTTAPMPSPPPSPSLLYLPFAQRDRRPAPRMGSAGWRVRRSAEE